MKTNTKLWLGIFILILLTPLGLLLPAYFKADSAWGEWGVAAVRHLVGYIPRGLERLSALWGAPVADYAFRGRAEKSLANLSFAYIISASIGVIVCVVLAWALGRIFTKKNRERQR